MDVDRVLTRARALAQISDQPGQIHRLGYSGALAKAAGLVREWMQEAGLSVQIDPAGNLLGYAQDPYLPAYWTGSHLDTVPGGGAYDGALGILLGLELAESLQGDLPLVVVALAEEEGSRFGRGFLGSSALTGTFAPEWLELKDRDGITLRNAVKNFGLDPGQIPAAQIPAGQILGFIEAHIEQGPVLAELDQPLGIVTGIVGQIRAELTLRGQARHAGTTPMTSRRDALAGAAQLILLAENIARDLPQVVATVGDLKVLPGSGNVIPGQVHLSLDLRHPQKETLQAVWQGFLSQSQEAAARRRLDLSWKILQQTPPVALDSALVGHMVRVLPRAPQLYSGAGHDAQILSQIAPSAMLFIRSPGGVSHHPAESVNPEDVEAALKALRQFFLLPAS
jgi:allantoate deiminase